MGDQKTTPKGQPPLERFQADGFFWQVYQDNRGSSYTALAKTVPFIHFGKLFEEPWTDDVWFESGATAEVAYLELRASLGLPLEENPQKN